MIAIPFMLAALAFEPGQAWLDTAGKPIQAHGGGILAREGVYYWYGEDKTLGNFNRTGVACYSSRDLYRWKREGVALPKEALPEQFRDTGICERPKVIYNAARRKYVMWMHLDDRRYKVSEAGVAEADSPTGPFRLSAHFRPIGQETFRDMNLLLDDDGRAYVFYASEDNKTMYVVRLDGAFTGPETPAVEGRTWARIFTGQSREAPAPFKYGGKYFLITSGCSGWAPNRASYAVADNILGPWTTKGDPSRGPDAATTFHSQSTFVIPAPGKPAGSFIFMADRWNERNLADSRYVWLPFTVRGDEFTLEYRDRWDLSALDRRDALWEPLRFLIGEWAGEGGGAPGQVTDAAFSFQWDVQQNVVVRRSYSAYPTFTHEDLLVIYKDPGAGRLRAVYFDGEGHVIQYDNVAAVPGGVQFAGGPYRLTYTSTEPGALTISFDIGSKAHVTGTARRK